jgi:hypothetical protein
MDRGGRPTRPWRFAMSVRSTQTFVASAPSPFNLRSVSRSHWNARKAGAAGLNSDMFCLTPRRSCGHASVRQREDGAVMSGLRCAPGIALTFWLVALPAQAQRPIAAAAERWCADPTGPCGVAAASASVSTPVDASLPAAGKTDRHFPVLLAAFTTTASADLAISMYQIGRGAARRRPSDRNGRTLRWRSR